MVRHSEIFDLYAKAAMESGLISRADEEETSSKPDAPKESAKLRKYKKSPHPRAGSDDISTIEALYGVKPDAVNKYEFNIMEAAHPKPVVIGPAYDRMNALVENNIERQNIAINIARTPNNGNLTQGPKLAKKELMLELVRLANDLDMAGKDDLRKIADNCIIELNGLKKNAFDWDNAWGDVKHFVGDEAENVVNVVKGLGAGAAVGAIAGALIGSFVEPGGGTIAGAQIGASIGGEGGFVAALFGKTPPIVRSVSQNAKETSDLIEALKKNVPPENPETQFLTSFQTMLGSLADTADRYNQTLSVVQSNPTAIKSEDHAVSVSKELATSLDTQIKNVSDMAALFNNKAENDFYKQFVSPGKLQQFVVYRFIDDAVDDVRHSIKSLMDAIKQFDGVIKGLHADMQGEDSQAETSTKRKQVAPMQEQGVPEEAGNFGEDDGDYDDFIKEIGLEPSEKGVEWLKGLK